ncbi:hypothetical protein V3C99_010618 [Haemonchus contortus]
MMAPYERPMHSPQNESHLTSIFHEVLGMITGTTDLLRFSSIKRSTQKQMKQRRRKWTRR